MTAHDACIFFNRQQKIIKDIDNYALFVRTIKPKIAGSELMAIPCMHIALDELYHGKILIEPEHALVPAESHRDIAIPPFQLIDPPKFICRYCGTVIVTKQKYCHECGQKIEWESKDAVSK